MRYFYIKIFLRMTTLNIKKIVTWAFIHRFLFLKCYLLLYDLPRNIRYFLYLDTLTTLQGFAALVFLKLCFIWFCIKIHGTYRWNLTSYMDPLVRLQQQQQGTRNCQFFLTVFLANWFISFMKWSGDESVDYQVRFIQVRTADWKEINVSV